MENEQSIEQRDAEPRNIEELEARYKELQQSYIDMEESNKIVIHASKVAQKKLIGAIIFILIFFISLGVYHWHGVRGHKKSGETKTARASKDSVHTKTYTVKPQLLTTSIFLTGELKPLKIVNFVAPFNSVVLKKNFEYGQMVAKGQLLIELAKGETENKYREAKSVFIKAQKRLKNIENWENGPEMSEKKRSLAKANSDLEAAKQKVADTEKLFKKGIVSASDFDQDKRSYEDQKNSYNAALDALKSTRDQGGKDEVYIARLELENAKFVFEELKKNLEMATVYAPFSGAVLLPELLDKEKKGKSIEKGVSVNQGDTLVSLGNMESLSVKTKVDEIDIKNVKKGQNVKVTSDVFPGIVKSGIIEYVSSQATKGEGGKPVFDVVVVLDPLKKEETERARLGITANVEIITMQKPDAIMIPIDALNIDKEGLYVYVKDKNSGKPNKIAVERGLTTVDAIEITKGLKTGDVVTY